jgi:hypothetical protein
MTRKLISVIKGTRDTVKVYRDRDWGEYVVIPAHKPKASYHTTDKDDALDTAAVMAELSTRLGRSSHVTKAASRQKAKQEALEAAIYAAEVGSHQMQAEG